MDNGIDLSSIGVEVSSASYICDIVMFLEDGMEVSKAPELSSAWYVCPSSLVLTPSFDTTGAVELGAICVITGVTLWTRMVKLHMYAKPMEDGDTGQIIQIGYYVDFAGSPRVIDEDESVSFRDGTYGPEIAAWDWSFGDGEHDAVANPDHVYDDPGSYTVKMEVWTVDNEYACIVKPFYITVLDVPDGPEEGGGSYMLNEFIDDISFRIRNPKGDKWQYYPHILRGVNRLYHRLCREYRLVQKTLEMDFSTLSTFVQYWSLPADYINLSQLSPDFTYIVPTEFDEDDEERFTINRGRIYFSGIDNTYVVSMVYYSSGNTIVNKADEDLAAGECNKPEWTDRAMDQALYYGACIELSDNYPGRAADVEIYNRLELQLKDAFANVQDKDYEVPYDPPMDSVDDAYDFGD